MCLHVGHFSNQEEKLYSVSFAFVKSDEDLDYDETAGQSPGIIQEDGKKPGPSSRVEQSLDGRRDQSVAAHASLEQTL